MIGSLQKERRKYKRRNLIFYIPVIETGARRTLGRISDISPRGFKLDSEYQLHLEKDFHLGLNTTPNVVDIDFIGFVARSKWCKPDAVEPCQYYIGFDIIDISPHAAEIVQCIVDKYGAQDLPAN